MKTKKVIIIYFFIISFLGINTSCVDSYIPDNQINFEPKLVVEALITDENEWQKIKIHQTSKLDTLKTNPLSGCFVEVLDNYDNSFVFNETSEGIYEGKIDSQYFTINHQFKLHLIVENGEEYESDFEKYTPSPEIDSIHYNFEEQPTADPEITYQGLQFYYDFKANESYSRYYRISLEETWEYHAEFPITYIYSDGFKRVKPDSSLYFCYNSKSIDDIFLISTKGFLKNEFPNFKLNYVNNQTHRLKFKYSILFKLYSLSENAYQFWSNLKKNNQENGGIFSSQPALIRGNIYKMNDPSMRILGYFGISSSREKRFFIMPSDVFKVYSDLKCIATPFVLEPGGWPISSDPNEWPIYFILIYDSNSESTILGIADQACFDCTKSGGKITKPDFW